MLYRNSLRIASVLSILHAVMHQFGMMQKPANPAEIALVDSMSAYQTDVMGSVRSYTDFYSGMGVFLTIMLIGFGMILWQLSNAHDRHQHGTRAILLTIGLTFLAFTIASIRYFFIAPIIMEALVAGLVLFAYLKRRGVA